MEIKKYRLVDNKSHRMGPNWSFRFEVQEYVEPGRFLFWKTGDYWRVYRQSLTYDDAKELVNLLKEDTDLQRVID